MQTLSSYINEQKVIPNRKEFMVIKPEFLQYKNDILEILRKNNIIPISELQKTLTLSEAKKLYKKHSKKDFYPTLCKYMTSGDSIGILLNNYAGANFAKIKDEIRTKFGKSKLRNCIHSSDTGLDVARESKIYFATPKI